jgi:hypothetical protein
VLERPSLISCPLAGRVIEGTADNGARSETVDWVRLKDGLGAAGCWEIGGGEDGRIPIEDDGTGVGYRFSSSVVVVVRSGRDF